MADACLFGTAFSYLELCLLLLSPRTRETVYSRAFALPACPVSAAAVLAVSVIVVDGGPRMRFCTCAEGSREGEKRWGLAVRTRHGGRGRRQKEGEDLLERQTINFLAVNSQDAIAACDFTAVGCRAREELLDDKLRRTRGQTLEESREVRPWLLPRLLHFEHHADSAQALARREHASICLCRHTLSARRRRGHMRRRRHHAVTRTLHVVAVCPAQALTVGNPLRRGRTGTAHCKR